MSSDATQLLRSMSSGDGNAANQLLPLVYTQLHRLAERYMAAERSDHLLQPTALVHEAYVKLVDQSQVDWKGRTHFMGVAAKAMQHVLIDCARSRDRKKRGGPGVNAANDESETEATSKNVEQNWRRVALTDAFSLKGHDGLDVLEVEDALAKMATLDERQTRIAQMRIFGELNDDEIADILDVSQRTVERDWKMAKAWLRRELSNGQ